MFLLAISPVLSMEKLTDKTKSEIKDILRQLECDLAFGDSTFENSDAQRKSIKEHYDQAKALLETSGIKTPKERDFNWLVSIKEQLPQQPGYLSRLAQLKELYAQAQHLVKYKRIRKLKEKL